MKVTVPPWGCVYLVYCLVDTRMSLPALLRVLGT